MAYTTIDNGKEYFNTVLWTGDASSDKSISGVGFQPDWVWAKNRSDGNDHQIIDSNRGAGKILRTNSTGAELTRSVDVGAGGLQNFETDGFDVHSTTNNTNLNDNGELNVGWCWKANGGTTTTNDASATSVGTIDSVYQANTTAGFSIVTYTGTGSAGTIAHGLGATPHWVLVKNRSTGSTQWYNQHIGNSSASKGQSLSTDGAEQTLSAVFGDTRASSTVFTVGDNNSVNNSGDNYVAYIFAPIKGYSKFGSYTGNGNADGPFIYTGFKPAWVMVKCSSSSQSSNAHWVMYDNTRNTFNVVDELLFANLSNDESANDSSRPIDMLSNGFKLRGSGSASNSSGATYIYMAFAEHPFVSSKGVPTTAR